MQSSLIGIPRSVIVAMDVPTAEEHKAVARSVKGVPKIGGFKIGIEGGLDGLAHNVEMIYAGYEGTTCIIYDHQKAGNDIPAMGSNFARAVKRAGCDAAILFPFAGPVTQEAWIKACQDADLHVIVGGVMTHENFLVGEGGYISDDAPERIFNLACTLGVKDFVVPGTKLNWVNILKSVLDQNLGQGNSVLYAPGFVTQGGDISECGAAAGERFHPIVGSAIYKQDTEEARRAAAMAATSKL